MLLSKLFIANKDWIFFCMAQPNQDKNIIYTAGSILNNIDIMDHHIN